VFIEDVKSLWDFCCDNGAVMADRASHMVDHPCSGPSLAPHTLHSPHRSHHQSAVSLTSLKELSTHPYFTLTVSVTAVGPSHVKHDAVSYRILQGAVYHSAFNERESDSSTGVAKAAEVLKGWFY
jgi:hypothetical protein